MRMPPIVSFEVTWRYRLFGLSAISSGCGIVVYFDSLPSQAEYTRPCGVGVLESSRSPRARNDVAGFFLRVEKIHRDHRELERGAALDEEHLEVLRGFRDLAGKSQCARCGPLRTPALRCDSSMSDMPVPAKSTNSALTSSRTRQRQRARAGAEVVGSHAEQR